jgi:hypothetical protein
MFKKAGDDVSTVFGTPPDSKRPMPREFTSIRILLSYWLVPVLTIVAAKACRYFAPLTPFFSLVEGLLDQTAAIWTDFNGARCTRLESYAFRPVCDDFKFPSQPHNYRFLFRKDQYVPICYEHRLVFRGGGAEFEKHKAEYH